MRKKYETYAFCFQHLIMLHNHNALDTCKSNYVAKIVIQSAERLTLL